MDTTAIRRTKVGDIDTVTSAVTAAWITLPHSTWLVSSNLLRGRILVFYAAMWIERGLVVEQIDITDDGTAVATRVDQSHGGCVVRRPQGCGS